MANVKEGPNSLLIGIIILLVAGGLFMHFGSAPDSSSGAAVNDSVKAASLVGTAGAETPVTTVSVGTLSLDSELVSFTTTDNDSASVTIADADSDNYNADTHIISFQVDAEVDSTTTAGYTVFTLKARNKTGISTTLLKVNESGTLTAPTTAMTKEMTFQFTEDVISGFATRDSIITQAVTASAPMLKDTAGELYSPIVVQATNTKLPELKVDGTKDTHSYPWLIDTTPKTIDVTFKIDFTEINKMTDVTTRQIITVDAPGADDGPYTIELIRIAAI